MGQWGQAARYATGNQIHGPAGTPRVTTAKADPEAGGVTEGLGAILGTPDAVFWGSILPLSPLGGKMLSCRKCLFAEPMAPPKEDFANLPLYQGELRQPRTSQAWGAECALPDCFSGS